PLADTGLQIDGHEAFAKEIVARAMTAIEVGRRGLDRPIHETGFRIGGYLCPHAGIAVDRPGVIFPGLAANFTRSWNRVERPQRFAGADVERAREPLAVVVRLDGEPFFERRTHEHDIADDGRRRVQSDFTGVQIDRLTIAEDHTFLEIDYAILAERRDHRAGVRVERDEAITSRDKQDAIVAA